MGKEGTRDITIKVRLNAEEKQILDALTDEFEVDMSTMVRLMMVDTFLNTNRFDSILKRDETYALDLVKKRRAVWEEGHARYQVAHWRDLRKALASIKEAQDDGRNVEKNSCD